MGAQRHEDNGTSPLAADTARPVPFTLRVAVAWTALRDAPHADDGELFFRTRAPLTGDLALTGGGRDAAFSDIEVP